MVNPLPMRFLKKYNKRCPANYWGEQYSQNQKLLRKLVCAKLFLVPSTQFEDLWRFFFIFLLQCLWSHCIASLGSLIHKMILLSVDVLWVLCTQKIPVCSRHDSLATSVLRKSPSHSLLLRATILVWAFLYCYVFFTFTSGWSHLISLWEWSPPLLVARLFSGAVTRLKHWQGLLSVLSEWVDEFQGQNLCLGLHYIGAHTTSLCKSVLCLFSLTSFNVYSSDDHIQCTWS